MKVSTQPMSAFAVYSEKLKQKKKKSNFQESNRINKSKKVKNPLSNGLNKLKKVNEEIIINSIDKLDTVQVVESNKSNLNKPKKNAEKKSWQMKEIGYILQKLAERSVDTSSPRVVALLNSFDEANKNLQLKVSDGMEENLENLIGVKDKKKASRPNLKRKKGTKNVTISDANDGNHLNLESFTSEEFEENCDSNNLVGVLETTTSSKKIKSKEPKCLQPNKLKVSSKEEAVSQSNSKVSKAKLTKKNKSILESGPKKQRIRNTTKSFQKGEAHTNVKKLFEWLVLPVTEKDFMFNFWEKKPLLIQREGNRRYFTELLSTETIDSMLRENNVCFTKHLDVTSYTDGVRETHNLTGRAQANVVWDFYSNGCSVRLLNPQIFMPKIHALNATLQEYFGCFVGANVYLTPPNSQGFAPHYDDIEAFVLQIEGKKHWKVYCPRNDAEVLPRFSSPNFSQDDVGEPFLDVTLEPGDLLYFPRGFIHQASTVEGEHSLHITLSAYQKTSWVDLFEKVLPIALKRAAESDVEFRRGLPRDYLGLEHHGSPREKQRFVDTAQALMSKLGHYLQNSLGAGVDLMGAQFMHDALPPVLLPGEKEQSSAGAGLKLRDGKLEGRVEFQMDTCVKLIRYNICRLVVEEEEVRLYHCLDNSLEYHGEEPQFLILPPEGVQIVTVLQNSYPGFIRLQDIPHEDPEALLTLISDLWDAGLLSAKNLPVVEES